jgi:hypothetical protein
VAGLVVLPLRRGKGKQVAMMGCEWLGEVAENDAKKIGRVEYLG